MAGESLTFRTLAFAIPGPDAAHVVEAERSYARKIDVRHKKFAIDDAAALSAMRRNIAEVLESPSSGDPVIARGWPSRYAARRIAWHVIDHMWQMQDG